MVEIQQHNAMLTFRFNRRTVLQRSYVYDVSIGGTQWTMYQSDAYEKAYLERVKEPVVWEIFDGFLPEEIRALLEDLVGV